MALLDRFRTAHPVPRTPQTGARRARQRLGAGHYIGCQACGRLLRIEWAVRSLVCSCGARVQVPKPDGTRA